MIDVAHSCALLGIPYDSTRLFAEPLSNYELGLRLVIERVSDTRRAEAERIEAQR